MKTETPNDSSTPPPTIVLGVIGADCHAVGNRILERLFKDGGFKVVNLGVMVSQEEFISAAIETGARAILVSSLYGHGEMDCQGFREKCSEAGLDEILLYIGGNLVVGKTDFSLVREKFLKMGFDQVFPPGAAPEEGIAALKEDLARRIVAKAGN
ncbi:MAG: methylaspartate mutase subunit S [Verrucomicrobiae bacterium]|nr:methylaspartate mutase subunit S [Verrucomicrobiae bacterium]